MALISDILLPPGWRIKHAAHLTALASPGTLPSQCTLSVWFDDGAGYEHVHIQRDGSAVNVRINGAAAASYGGTIGTSYAAFLKNVLTSLYGGFAGTYAELHCADQLVDVEVFGKLVGVSWRPIKVVMPEYETLVWNRAGAATASHPDATYPPAKAFDGIYDVNGNGCVVFVVPTSSPWLQLDYGSGNEKVLKRYTLWGWGNNAARSPRAWTLNGSHNGTAWTQLDSVSGTTSTNGITRTVSNTTAYRYYRLVVTATVDGSGPGIEELMLSVADGTDTYGPQGAYLDFAAASTLGEDVSGNTNDWTVTGTQSANRP
ncbi:MAG: discoidin domain-containing protein [Pseudomonadota bacterium]